MHVDIGEEIYILFCLFLERCMVPKEGTITVTNAPQDDRSMFRNICVLNNC